MLDFCYNYVVSIETSWKDYITGEYLIWRADKLGRKGSAAAFAREINISPQLLSDWMNKGQKPTDQENISKLVNRFGYKVYDVLGLRRPDANDPKSYLTNLGIPSEIAEKLILAGSESEEKIKEAGTSIETPEGKEIIKTVFSKFGIRFNDNDTE